MRVHKARKFGSYQTGRLENSFWFTVIFVWPRAGGTSRSFGIRTCPKLCLYSTHQTASQLMSYTVKFPGKTISMSSPWYPLNGTKLSVDQIRLIIVSLNWIKRFILRKQIIFLNKKNRWYSETYLKKLLNKFVWILYM